MIDFNQEDYPERECCGLIEYFDSIGYKVPFYKPFYWSDGTIKSRKWAIRLYRLTKAGNISTKKTKVAFISYCPFCGKSTEEAVSVGAS